MPTASAHSCLGPPWPENTAYRYAADSEPTFDRDYGREVYGYYGINYPF